MQISKHPRNQKIYIKCKDMINSLNTREFNEDFPINTHRFSKPYALLNLIHDPYISAHYEHI